MELSEEEIDARLRELEKKDSETADEAALIAEYKEFLRQINAYWDNPKLLERERQERRARMKKWSKEKSKKYWEKERGLSTAFACYELGIENFFEKYDGQESVFAVIERARRKGEFGKIT